MDSHASSTEKEVQRILRGAGIESAPVDPLSMEALKEWVVQKKEEQKLKSLSRKAPPPSFESALFSTKAASSDVPWEASKVEKYLIAKLESQNELILGLYQKIAELDKKIDLLDRGESPVPPNSSSSTRIRRTLRFRSRSDSEPQETEIDQNEGEQANIRNNNGNDANLAQVLERRSWSARWESAVDRSKFLQVFVVFFQHCRPPHVQVLNAGLFFKAFVMAVLIANRVSRKKGNGGTEQLYMGSGFIALGLLYQTGLLPYVWRFCVTENIPVRIWRGQEDWKTIWDPSRPVRRIPRGIARNPAAAPAEAGGQGQQQQAQADWRHTFLGGRIAHPPPQVNIMWRLVQDILYIFGSFFLSIFPVWQPQPLVPRQQPQDRPAVVEEANNGGRGEGEQGLPPVADPRDAMEAAEDDDDEQD